MITYAVILAGGSGVRMHLGFPKQFAVVGGKPVLQYTLESFEAHAGIDRIVVVCRAGFEDELRQLAADGRIDKLWKIVEGGDTVQESIRNGVYALEGAAADDDLVVIHDGIRPLVDPEVLTDVLAVAREKGNAVSSLPYNEQIFLVDEDDPSTTKAFIPRETLRRVSTPQAYRYRLLTDAYHRAFAEQIGIYGSHYTNTMMVELGVTLHFAKGSDRNLKLTTPADMAVFKAFLELEEAQDDA